MVWQSSEMTYPAVNDPNITSGFTFNKRSVSLASELRSFVVLRPSSEQSAPSAARFNTVSPCQMQNFFSFSLCACSSADTSSEISRNNMLCYGFEQREIQDFMHES